MMKISVVSIACFCLTKQYKTQKNTIFRKKKKKSNSFFCSKVVSGHYLHLLDGWLNKISAYFLSIDLSINRRDEGS